MIVVVSSVFGIFYPTWADDPEFDVNVVFLMGGSVQPPLGCPIND